MTDDADLQKLLDEVFEFAARTQTLTITDQLTAGARFLDLRLTAKEGSGDLAKLQVSHGMKTDKSLQQAVEEMQTFLETNTTECLLVYLRRDYMNRESFPADHVALRSYLNNLTFVHGVVEHKNLGDMTLGDLRGKIVLLAKGHYAST